MPAACGSGVPGFTVNTVGDAVRAVRRIEMIERATCRRVFEERFDAQCMASTMCCGLLCPAVCESANRDSAMTASRAETDGRHEKEALQMNNNNNKEMNYGNRLR
ncbi:MAG: hypothetical protein JWQ87_5313 [Candidatus Sulfotelmatobacter sp.]|nr:hypothetical protein [Candidatus Sulfotelmatobacter sp.]